MEILLDKILGKRNIAVLSALLTMGLLGGCGSKAAGAAEASEVQALKEAGAEAFSADDEPFVCGNSAAP